MRIGVILITLYRVTTNNTQFVFLVLIFRVTVKGEDGTNFLPVYRKLIMSLSYQKQACERMTYKIHFLLRGTGLQRWESILTEVKGLSGLPYLLQTVCKVQRSRRDRATKSGTGRKKQRRRDRQKEMETATGQKSHRAAGRVRFTALQGSCCHKAHSWGTHLDQRNKVSSNFQLLLSPDLKLSLVQFCNSVLQSLNFYIGTLYVCQIPN